MADNLLIVQDERLLGAELTRHYHRQGWEVVLVDTWSSPEDLLRCQGLSPLVVLSDMNLPGGNALDLLEKVSPQRAGSEIGK